MFYATTKLKKKRFFLKNHGWSVQRSFFLACCRILDSNPPGGDAGHRLCPRGPLTRVSALSAWTPETVWFLCPFVTLAFGGQIYCSKRHSKKNKKTNSYLCTWLLKWFCCFYLADWQERTWSDPTITTARKMNLHDMNCTILYQLKWQNTKKTSYPCQNTLCYTFKVHTNSNVVDQCKGK